MSILRKLASTAFIAASALTQASASAESSSGDSLASIDHVILFMQENRAFDHYYGTLAGVRGFQDPTELAKGKSSTYYQPLSLPSNGSFLLPWYIAENPEFAAASDCMTAGSNDWTPNHEGWNDGAWNNWVVANTPYTIGHVTRNEIPSWYSIADYFTIGDMYMQSVIGPTNPNRVTWVSGTVNVPGGNTQPDQGGVYIENWATPGCEDPGFNCFPLSWKTTPEYLEEAGIDWYVYQDVDNFGDNPFVFFEQYITAPPGSALASKALSFEGMQKFFDDCKSGNLPEVSYIVGPMEVCEHPPWMPRDGAWFVEQVVNAVVNSPVYKSTALLISYDESGGWMDHVPAYISQNGTAGEWLWDPENITHYVPSGPGPRVPFVIVSPWTTGGNVFVEPSDHNSQILFLEEWQMAKGKNITSNEMAPWRREFMSNLVNAFDFANPNYTAVTFNNAQTPVTNFAGNYMGTIDCLNEFGGEKPPVPFNQTAAQALAVEAGFKKMRGNATEGRFNVFIDQASGLALTVNTTLNTLSAVTPTPGYLNVSQGFFIQADIAPLVNAFTIQWANNASLYVTTPTQPLLASTDQLNSAEQGEVLFTGAYTVPLLSSAQSTTFTIGYNPEVDGYYLMAQAFYVVDNPSPAFYVTVAKSNGAVSWTSSPSYFDMYAVTYPTAPTV